MWRCIAEERRTAATTLCTVLSKEGDAGSETRKQLMSLAPIVVLLRETKSGLHQILCRLV
ncbi:hypothetical protein JMJ77_0007053 [Colletotrichum scovillei]|uniref:Uncharacterized protein n=1 Tax=Colletotrichum scovillei TaxID=1209932 RepID=A0A9P7RCC2_9PEZI|nr:hypothetical protein JMJ77_0007053 [Colletotrichum scovillei]KAG7074054.1 hypothetical protein JMJ76_0010542 [Colletotrichum scovillei]KAG7081131.1 hypothetical protein JMJ78_0003259 [Colletotrichum scovillei]